MDWNTVLFLIFPYVAIAIAIVVTVYRSVFRPFTISSLSSQLLESKKLYWGSIAFHWGIILVLLGHLLAVIFPKGITLWNSVPLRLYLLEFTGLAMGLWALGGLLILFFRRLSNRRVWVVTSPMDLVILLLLLVSVITGVLVATAYRFGSYWFTGVLAPYLLSIITFTPKIGLVAPLPWVIKLHVLNFFVIMALYPFSRLVHVFTYPLGYLLRPWQLVIWVRRRKGLAG